MKAGMLEDWPRRRHGGRKNKNAMGGQGTATRQRQRKKSVGARTAPIKFHTGGGEDATITTKLACCMHYGAGR